MAKLINPDVIQGLRELYEKEVQRMDAEETNPNLKIFRSDKENEAGVALEEFETFPYPRPLCPQCHRKMRWFKMKGLILRGWFCTCLDEALMETIHSQEEIENRLERLEKVLAIKLASAESQKPRRRTNEYQLAEGEE